MAKHSSTNISEKTTSDALSIAKSIQKPSQTKAQTKLIAQGIEKGIDLYKKQQKAKARELDKALKKAKQQSAPVAQQTEVEINTSQQYKLTPWLLLAISWLLFSLAYIFDLLH